MRNDARTQIRTVSQLARLSGTSVRTLHHYDAIGLLKPATVGENGYRYYGRRELMRLQQILIHREFGVALSDIPALLDAEEPDRVRALREQQARLEKEADRYRRLARTIARTIAELEGRETIMDTQIYEGFSPEKQAGYEAWIIEKYGEPARAHVEHGKATVATMSKGERQDWMAEVADLEADFGRAMQEGAAADDPALDPLLKRHHAWVARTWKSPPTAEAYAGLGRLYVDNPDFRARYEAVAPRLADWLAEAMAAYGRRVLSV